MPKRGDRVIVEGTRIGNPKREGTLLEIVGPLIRVEWTDGTTSLFKPGAGSVAFEPRSGAARAAAAAPKAATKSVGQKAVKARSGGKTAPTSKKAPSAKKSAKPRKR